MYKEQILITSIQKSINKSKISGLLDLSILSLFDAYSYYINLTNNNSKLVEENKCLKENLVRLMYAFPQDICNYKLILPDITNNVSSNNPPTVDDNFIDIGLNEDYTFSLQDFTKNYSDPENDIYSSIIVKPNNLNGKLYYNNVELNSQLEIDVNNISNLKYIRENSNAFNNDIFIFRIADSNINKLYSSNHTISISGISSGDNQPATIGDITINVDNRAITVLTLPMFTSQLAPPYNDPENDLIDAIKIDEISDANKGVYKYNGSPITTGQIITREDIENNLFTHESANTDDIWSDVFNWSARDEGSGIWVE